MREISSSPSQTTGNRLPSACCWLVAGGCLLLVAGGCFLLLLASCHLNFRLHKLNPAGSISSSAFSCLCYCSRSAYFRAIKQRRRKADPAEAACLFPSDFRASYWGEEPSSQASIRSRATTFFGGISKSRSGCCSMAAIATSRFMTAPSTVAAFATASRGNH